MTGHAQDLVGMPAGPEHHRGDQALGDDGAVPGSPKVHGLVVRFAGSDPIELNCTFPLQCSSIPCVTRRFLLLVGKMLPPPVMRPTVVIRTALTVVLAVADSGPMPLAVAVFVTEPAVISADVMV